VTARSALATLLPGVAGLIGGYQRAWLRRDLVAGLTVWAVVVPQALAYGELAGLSPVTGLYTAAGRSCSTRCSAAAAMRMSGPNPRSQS
jgi:SulP family sulfate permease